MQRLRGLKMYPFYGESCGQACLLKTSPWSVKRLDEGKSGAERTDAVYTGSGTREVGTDLRDIRKGRNSYLIVCEVGRDRGEV